LFKILNIFNLFERERESRGSGRERERSRLFAEQEVPDAGLNPRTLKS